MRAWVLAAALLGCAQEEQEKPDMPAVVEPAAEAGAGAVLTVDGLELTAAELEQLCADIESLYPEYARVHARRLALTNEFLPRLALRAADPQRWAEARQACAEADPERLEPARHEGGFHGLGLGLWSAARHLAPGVWSAPVELVGRFVRLRLDELQAAQDPREERLVLALIECAYVDPAQARETLDAALDRARLTILDPAFGEAVPEAWKHRMRGSKP